MEEALLSVAILLSLPFFFLQTIYRLFVMQHLPTKKPLCSG